MTWLVNLGIFILFCWWLVAEGNWRTFWRWYRWFREDPNDPYRRELMVKMWPFAKETLMP